MKINTLCAGSPDLIHRVQNVDSMQNPESQLERQRCIRKKNKIVLLDNGNKNEEVYEPNRTIDTRGPREKTGPYTDGSFESDFPVHPGEQKRLEYRHHRHDRTRPKKYAPSRKRFKNLIRSSSSNLLIKNSQTVSDYVQQIEGSSVSISIRDERGHLYGGSGFFINKQDILTCSHVVGVSMENTQPKVLVTFKQFNVPATVVSFDLNLDIAVIRIDSRAYGIENQIYPINLGNSGNLRKGESLLLIGDPLDTQKTVASGMVANNELPHTPHLFLIDGRLLPGVSGGMIYSYDRQAVVGLASAYANDIIQGVSSDSFGIGVKIDFIKEHLKQNNIRFTFHEKNAASLNSLEVYSSCEDGLSIGNVKRIGTEIGIDWESCDFSANDLLKGMKVEMEHDNDKQTDVVPDNSEKLNTIAKIAWRHLKESPLYYDELKKVEKKFDKSAGAPHTYREDFYPGGYNHQSNQYRMKGYPKYHKLDSPANYYRTLGKGISVTMESSPLDGLDDTLKNNPLFKNRKDIMDDAKGKWLLNIPLEHHMGITGSIQIYRSDKDKKESYTAYKDGEMIFRSTRSDENMQPLISLIKYINGKFDFDKSYKNHTDVFGPVIV